MYAQKAHLGAKDLNERSAHSTYALLTCRIMKFDCMECIFKNNFWVQVCELVQLLVVWWSVLISRHDWSSSRADHQTTSVVLIAIVYIHAQYHTVPQHQQSYYHTRAEYLFPYILHRCTERKSRVALLKEQPTGCMPCSSIWRSEYCPSNERLTSALQFKPHLSSSTIYISIIEYTQGFLCTRLIWVPLTIIQFRGYLSLRFFVRRTFLEDWSEARSTYGWSDSDIPRYIRKCLRNSIHNLNPP